MVIAPRVPSPVNRVKGTIAQLYDGYMACAAPSGAEAGGVQVAWFRWRKTHARTLPAPFADISRMF